MKHVENFAKDLGMFLVYSAAAALLFSVVIVPFAPAGIKGWLKTLFPGLVA